MKRRDLFKMLGWLSQVLTCPICGNHFSTEHTKVVENRSERRSDELSLIIHSDCANCKSSIAFNVAALGAELFTVGSVSDLTTFDAVKFRKVAPVSADDVLALHTFLENFDGDFEKVLSTY